MRMFLSELRKLLGNPRILLVIAAAVVINVVFLALPEFDEYSPESYNALWNTIDEMPATERADFFAQRIADNNDPRWFTGSGSNEFTDDFYSEQALLKYVYNETAQVDGYSEYLLSIDQAAENMKSFSFFADENSFNYRNIIKTREDFSGLSADNVKLGKSKGILLATRFGVTDLLLLLLTVIFGVRLLSSEREGGFLPLFRSAVNGKGRLAAAKLAALGMSAFLAASLLYGSSFLTGVVMYGFGDTDRAFASVYGFFSCGLQMSVSGFLVLYMLVKLLLCAVFSAVVFLLLSLPFGSAVGFAAVGGFTATESALYFLIPTTSVFSPLHQINIVAIANSGELIGKYLNINLAGYPVSAIPATIFAGIAADASCAVGGVFCFALSGERKQYSGKGVLPGRHTNIVLHELYKSFFSGKGLLILLAAGALLAAFQKPVKPHYNDISEYYYYNYISEISGEYTEEKSAYIDRQLEAAMNDFSDEAKYRIEALEKLRTHADYLKEHNGSFVADKGFQMLTGGDEVRTYDRLITAVKMLLLVLIVSFSYNIEYRYGGDMLLRASKNGRFCTFAAKIFSAFVVSLVILAMFDGSWIYSVLSAYGTDGISAPACSIERLCNYNVSIALYLLLTEAGRLFGMTAASALVFAVTRWSRSYSVTVVVSAVMFAVPPLLSVMGFKFMDYFILNPLLTGNILSYSLTNSSICI